MALPPLPVGGPVRLLAIAGTISLTAFLASTLVLLRPGKKRMSVWAAATCGLSLLSFGLGRVASALHPLAALAIVSLAIRNVVRFDGSARSLQAIGLVSWVIALIAARALFAG